jgi:hypothetical protein
VGHFAIRLEYFRPGLDLPAERSLACKKTESTRSKTAGVAECQPTEIQVVTI